MTPARDLQLLLTRRHLFGRSAAGIVSNTPHGTPLRHLSREQRPERPREEGHEDERDR